MVLNICKDSPELARLTSSWCEQKVNELKARSIYLPAGSTPIPLYQLWTRENPAFLRNLQLIQIDDVLTGPKAGIFKNFFSNYLSNFADRFQWIGEKYNQGDLTILGLGLNGHIAFHEPELPKNFYNGCVRLSELTCKNLGAPYPTWGITYGASAFLNSRAIAMIVSGSAKRDILKRLLLKDPSLPASVLMDHPDFTIWADKDAHP